MQRKTNIIATLGPATHSEKVLLHMAPYIDMVRLNFSWGTYEEMEELITLVRKVSDITGKKISIIQDLSGPRANDEGGHHFKETSTKAITEKDEKDLAFGISHNVDYVALSYVGGKEDVISLKNKITALGVNTPVIAKIERREAVEKIEEIIDVSDAIMIARGDLGQAFPIEEIPFIERKILAQCAKKNRFVIVATEMMLSMVNQERPTRAEVTDVAFAVNGGARAVMLSEETTEGKYPVQVVEMMDKIVQYAEEHNAL